MEGEPLEVARKAIQDVTAALLQVAEQFEAVEHQVMNARMSDALELPASELASAYSEAVDQRGRVRVPDTDPFEGPLPHEDPYNFWIATDDASLVARIAGALQVAVKLLKQLEEAQPEVAESPRNSG